MRHLGHLRCHVESLLELVEGLQPVLIHLLLTHPIHLVYVLEIVHIQLYTLRPRRFLPRQRVNLHLTIDLLRLRLYRRQQQQHLLVLLLMLH